MSRRLPLYFACALLACAFCFPALAEPPGGNLTFSTLVAGAVEPGRAALARAPAAAAFARELVGVLRLRGRRDFGPAGVDPAGSHRHADVSVALPLGERVSLRNGVRVHYRDEPARGLSELDLLPTAGVEIRF
jgi:hypothetical protein